MRFTPTLTLQWHRRPIHLIDRSVASSAKGCDIADTGVCPTHTHKHTFLVTQDASPGSHLEEGQLDLCPQLGGSWQEGWVGALSLKLIPSMQSCGTYRWGQDRKTSECTVAGSAGDLQGPWVHWGERRGEFKTICVHWCVNTFWCLCACFYWICPIKWEQCHSRCDCRNSLWVKP